MSSLPPPPPPPPPSSPPPSPGVASGTPPVAAATRSANADLDAASFVSSDRPRRIDLSASGSGVTSARAAASPSSKFAAKDVLATSDVRSSAASGDPRPLGGWYTADAADARGDISRDIVGVPAGTLAGTMSFIRSAEGESGGFDARHFWNGVRRRRLRRGGGGGAFGAFSARGAFGDEFFRGDGVFGGGGDGGGARDAGFRLGCGGSLDAIGGFLRASER